MKFLSKNIYNSASLMLLYFIQDILMGFVIRCETHASFAYNFDISKYSNRNYYYCLILKLSATILDYILKNKIVFERFNLMLIRNIFSSLILCIIAPLLISCHSGGGSSNNINGYVYTVPGSNIIQQCQVINNSINVSSCRNMNGSFSSPTAIAFNSTQTFAYVTNSGSNTVSICSLNNDKSFAACNSASIVFSAPTSLAIVGNNVYIANDNRTVSQCTVQDNGSLANCSNHSILATFKSITLNNNSNLYGLANNGSIYNYTLPAFNGSLVQYTESGSSNQLNYNSTKGLLYIAASNNILGGGIYGCNLTNNPATCITSFSTLSILLPLPLPAPVYSLTTTNNMAYFIDYAYEYSSNSTATFLNSCSINSDGTFGSCTASKLSAANLHNNGNLFITYIGI